MSQSCLRNCISYCLSQLCEDRALQSENQTPQGQTLLCESKGQWSRELMNFPWGIIVCHAEHSPHLVTIRYQKIPLLTLIVRHCSYHRRTQQETQTLLTSARYLGMLSPALFWISEVPADAQEDPDQLYNI